MGWVHTANARVAKSPVGRWFRLAGSGHKKERPNSFFFTEIRAGLATFAAVAYIIAVNASIVSDSGGTCVCQGGDDDPVCDVNEDYLICVNEVKRDIITATAAISALSTFCMGLFANLPVALAPGMGLNAYFAYTVVGYHGTGTVPYQIAVTAIFVEGWIFFALALFGMRQWLARAIPRSIKLATSVGVGLFLTLIGLTYSEGIGLIVGAQSTPLELAGCHPSMQDPDTGLCPDSDKMRYPQMWLGIFCGGILTAILMLYRVKGAIIFGILLVSIISWPRPTPVTYFPYTAVGDDNFNFFKKVVDFHKISKVLDVQQWNISGYGGQFGLALITFLYVDILDCTGTLYSMARYADLIDPVTQDFEGSTMAYMVDSISIAIGAIMGTPPVTAFVESAAGIGEGGKTGLTAMTTGICFFISIFFAPIFASIPPWATGCVLISIADGLIGGICTYITINTIVWILEKVSGGRIVPPNKAEKDHWTYKIPGGVLPPWLVRLSKGKKDFWREDANSISGVESDGAHEHMEQKVSGSPEPPSKVGPATASDATEAPAEKN